MIRPLHDFSLASCECRSGCSHHTTAAAELLERDYPAWRARLASTQPTR